MRHRICTIELLLCKADKHHGLTAPLTRSPKPLRQVTRPPRRVVEGVEGGVPLSRRTRFSGSRRAERKSEPMAPERVYDENQ